jgi:hypothetical protein
MDVLDAIVQEAPEAIGSKYRSKLISKVRKFNWGLHGDSMAQYVLEELEADEDRVVIRTESLLTGIDAMENAVQLMLAYWRASVPSWS